MLENKGNCDVYKYDQLKHGICLKIEHNISVRSNPEELMKLIKDEKSNVETSINESCKKEDEILKEVENLLGQWHTQASKTQVFLQVQEYLNIPEVKHTNNQWQRIDSYLDIKKISNRVYTMTCSIYERTKYDREKQRSVPVAWDVAWNVYLNSPKDGYRSCIAGQENKHYTDKSAALKYLEGRKKAYAHLFVELSPKVPKEYVDAFSYHGVLLPGYTVEE